VDLPLIPASLIRYLTHFAAVTESAVTMVSVAGFVQTFPAVIDCAALAGLHDRLDSGDRNCLRAFQSVADVLQSGFAALPIEGLVQSGQVSHSSGLHPRQWFLNVNSPADVKAVDTVLTLTRTG
jgi:molybdopterin-guanine dinucleotide biosynthesis protein A